MRLRFRQMKQTASARLAGEFIPLTACSPPGEVNAFRTSVPGVARSR